MHFYFHIPFCVTKCRYCAFYSQPGTERARLAHYLPLVSAELALRGYGRGSVSVDTLYIGGGTPSLLGPEGFRTLFASVPHMADAVEITVEVNPGDVTKDLAEALRECGVTRVSVGAQSFDEDTLRFLGRRHTAEQTVEAVSTLRHAGLSNIGLDLIAAIPGCSAEAFRSSIDAVLTLEPQHVSVYPLSIEGGTPFARDVEEGKLRPPSDDEALDAVAEAESRLCHGGYGRYEISNYALPGFACRHNLAIWRGEDYVGIGPAAASREGLRRCTNAPDVDRWCQAVAAGARPPAEEEWLTAFEDERERFVTGIRLAEGLCVDPATPLGAERLALFRRLEAAGVVEALDANRYALTARGREVADAVMAEF